MLDLITPLFSGDGANYSPGEPDYVKSPYKPDIYHISFLFNTRYIVDLPIDASAGSTVSSGRGLGLSIPPAPRRTATTMIEYLAVKNLKLAGNAPLDNKESGIIHRHLQLQLQLAVGLKYDFQVRFSAFLNTKCGWHRHKTRSGLPLSTPSVLYS